MDVLLAPLVMPDVGGFTLADRVALEHPALPVLLVSAYLHESRSDQRRPRSVAGFLRRPVEVRELGVMLERALAEGRARARRGRRVEPARAC